MPETTRVRDRVRVAAVQFATGTGLDENLAVCLRMLDAAAAEGAEPTAWCTSRRRSTTATAIAKQPG